MKKPRLPTTLLNLGNRNHRKDSRAALGSGLAVVLCARLCLSRGGTSNGSVCAGKEGQTSHPPALPASPDPGSHLLQAPCLIQWVNSGRQLPGHLGHQEALAPSDSNCRTAKEMWHGCWRGDSRVLAVVLGPAARGTAHGDCGCIHKGSAADPLGTCRNMDPMPSPRCVITTGTEPRCGCQAWGQGTCWLCTRSSSIPSNESKIKNHPEPSACTLLIRKCLSWMSSCPQPHAAMSLAF